MGDHKVNTNALRQKILDLAIHGKLVKQDPADEPASVMLEKLRAEKEAKIAAGEIKRNKNDSYIFKYTGTSGENKTDNNPERLEHNRHYEKFSDGRVKDIEDEIPFAVPEGWAWCRLKDIVTYIDDGDWIESKEQSDFGIRLLQTGNIGCGHFKDKEGNYHYISEETFKKLNCNEIYPGDILISRLPEPVGRACIIPNLSQRLVTAVDCAIIRLKQDIISRNYFIYYTQSAKYLELIKNNCMGTTRLRISRANLEKTLIPLPPLVEQHRIVTAIEAIFTQIELPEQNKADLQTAVKQAKSKILDFAIHGKLVPQDPADEPASMMLEKLRAEKDAKIASGEVKRGKNDSYIYKNSTDNCYYQKYADGCEENISDEIPFAVPEGWAWCRLPEVCRKPITDGTHNSPSNSASGDFLYITAKNIKNLAICLDDATYISKEIHESIYSRCSPELNDILLTKDGTIGEVAVNNLNYPFSMLSSIALIKPSNEILSWFLAYILISDLLQNKMKKEAKGSALKRIILAQINDFLIPLPPLAEQQRIVTKIEKLFAQLDSIIAALAD